MKRNMQWTIIALATLAFGLALGCSRDDANSAASLAEQAKQKAEAGLQQANQAAEKGMAQANAAAEAGMKRAGEAGEAVENKLDVAANKAESAVQRCLALAEQKSWIQAATPCATAAQQRPDDLQIRHALQQAKAAAAESLGGN